MSEKHFLDKEGLERLWSKIQEIHGVVDTRTSEEWAQHPEIISVKGRIYVWSDHQVLDGQNIPGFKVGDGDAYVVDLPFADAEYIAHIANIPLHVSEQDRARWDDKVTCSLEDNILIFSK